MAMIIPNIPNRRPAIKITRNISRGCELTLFENIIGCDRLLSITWTIQNPIRTYIVVGSISVWKSFPKLLIMLKIAANKEAINGPI